jgi:hypothetical protein
MPNPKGFAASEVAPGVIDPGKTKTLTLTENVVFKSNEYGG